MTLTDPTSANVAGIAILILLDNPKKPQALVSKRRLAPIRQSMIVLTA